MQTFMAECYWPGPLDERAPEVLNCAVQLAGEAVPGTAVRFLGYILVPADGMALFLFAASDEDAVRGVGRLAEIPFDRIVESVFVGFGQPRPDRY